MNISPQKEDDYLGEQDNYLAHFLEDEAKWDKNPEMKPPLNAVLTFYDLLEKF